MHIHRVFSQPSRLRDFGNIQFLYESEQENRSLLFRQSFCGLPNRLDLFVDRSFLLRRNTSDRPVVDLLDINTLRLSPELESTSPRVIPNQIDRNLHEPGTDAAVPAKRGPISVGVPKAILSQRLGQVHVAHRSKYKSKDSSSVLLHQPFEVL